jgi:hypothetical protein
MTTYYLNPDGVPGISESIQMGEKIVSLSNSPFYYIVLNGSIKLGELMPGYTLIDQAEYERHQEEARLDLEAKRAASQEAALAYQAETAAKKQEAIEFLVGLGMPQDLAEAAVR